MIRKLILLLLCAGLTSHTSAQTGGNNTYEFLNLSNPARVASLGGTLISVKDNDLNLSFQNPSLLDSAMHNTLSLSYVDYFTDIKYGYAAYSRTYKKIGSFSAGIQFLDYGNFTSASVTGEITGQFTAAEYALNLAYSRQLDSLFSVGATLKTIYSKLSEYTSYGNAVDIGTIYTNRKRLLSTALVIKNIGRQWKAYYIGREPLPFEIQLGFSKKISHAPFRLNITATHLEKWNLTYTNPSVSTVDPITGDTVEQKKVGKFADKLARH
ncbi:MAG: type IX secretion system protein PorQ, partial [Bacteroidota bacterium]